MSHVLSKMTRRVKCKRLLNNKSLNLGKMLLKYKSLPKKNLWI
jgi:hypothetical protein